jgi:hypothetical protein
LHSANSGIKEMLFEGLKFALTLTVEAELENLGFFVADEMLEKRVIEVSKKILEEQVYDVLS